MPGGSANARQQHGTLYDSTCLRIFYKALNVEYLYPQSKSKELNEYFVSSHFDA